LQLALPLPLAVEGLGEWFDLEFAQATDPDQARERLQSELPLGLALGSVRQVPLQGPSLSQELRAAHWSMELHPAAPICREAELAAGGQAAEWPPQECWQRAIQALLNSDTLLWSDTDKKGRPRSRDCRPYLLSIDLVTIASDPRTPGVELRWEAAIDPLGRSLRPDHLRAWLGREVGLELRLGRMRRLALLLST
jgi:radical SAM-linked protein